MLVDMLIVGMRKDEEPKTPRHASAAATRDDRLPHSRQNLYKGSILSRYNPSRFLRELLEVKESIN